LAEMIGTVRASLQSQRCRPAHVWSYFQAAQDRNAAACGVSSLTRSR
jgi:hypothetical protein